MSQTFTFNGKLRTWLLAITLTGAAFIGLGALTFSSGGGHGDGHGEAHEEVHHQAVHEDPTPAEIHAVEEEQHTVEMHTKEEQHPEGLIHGKETFEHKGETEEHYVHEADGSGVELSGDHHDGAHGEAGAHHEAAPVTLRKVVLSNTWAVLQYFLWIGIAAMFFLAAHTIGWAGWHILIQKVSLALMVLIPVMAAIGALVFLIGSHDIFEWTHKYLFDPENAAFDPLLKTKEAFLNTKSFAIFSLLWIGILTALFAGWWNKLKKQDTDPDLRYFRTARTLAAASIVLIAIINAFGVWHWIMSVEPHWYSTLFTWYTMASAATGMFAFTILIVMILKGMGYLPHVNENHFHDLGKYMFAISVFWTYLWFSQFMLIWYGNIPEETVYFAKRMESYPVLFYGAFIINFIVPFFVLMKRVSKRNQGVLLFMCILLIIGHWFDFFNSIVVPLVPSGGMGLIAIGSLLLFTGIAGFVTFIALSKVKDLESSQHPYYKESLIHHI